jgi:FkbM family methyltransferase
MTTAHTITQDGRTLVMPYGFGGWLDLFRQHFDDIWDTFQTDADTLDFSVPGEFAVRGWQQPLWLPSFVEPGSGVTQYAEWANLQPGETVIDLGAFAAMTAITFAEAVGPTGTVIALEPDPTNFDCAQRNLDTFTADTGIAVRLLPLAIWGSNVDLPFISEHTMGSSAAQYITGERGAEMNVEAITLSELAEREGLARVDYIKIDVEGAEMQAISDAEFFQRYRPRLSIECHDSFGDSQTIVAEALDRYGYEHTTVVQDFFPLPLIHAWPL